MRRRALTLLVAVPLVLAVAASARPRLPRAVRIVAACNPSENPRVEPQSRSMARQDNVEWREETERATAWMITPKDRERWPFADTIRGNQDAPAATGLPTTTTGLLASARDSVRYQYDVTITCQDGTVQHIDPEIVIGPS
jgi:hypothetical protein